MVTMGRPSGRSGVGPTFIDISAELFLVECPIFSRGMQLAFSEASRPASVSGKGFKPEDLNKE